MIRVDGVYDCVAKPPMGDQTSVLTIVGDGARFHGTNSNPLGSLDVTDGRIENGRLFWKMVTSVPMPMTLACEGIVDGDALTATIDTGMFGTFPMTGKRRG